MQLPCQTPPLLFLNTSNQRGIVTQLILPAPGTTEILQGTLQRISANAQAGTNQSKVVNSEERHQKEEPRELAGDIVKDIYNW